IRSRARRCAGIRSRSRGRRRLRLILLLVAEPALGPFLTRILLLLRGIPIQTQRLVLQSSRRRFLLGFRRRRERVDLWPLLFLRLLIIRKPQLLLFLLRLLFRHAFISSYVRICVGGGYLSLSALCRVHFLRWSRRQCLAWSLAEANFLLPAWLHRLALSRRSSGD